MTMSSFFKLAGAFLFGVLAIAVIYAACSGARLFSASAGSLEMRTYPVPPEYADEVRSALESVLSGEADGKAVGRVSLAPNGQLLVTAPVTMQQGVQHLLDDIAAHKPGSTPTVHFEVWFVKGMNGVATHSQGLAEIEPALQAISKAQGEQQYELVEKMAMNVRSGQHGEVSGAATEFEVRPSVRRGSADSSFISADLKMQMHAGDSSHSELRTETELKSGEVLVLGQNGVTLRAAESGKTIEQRLYYIIRATL